MSAKIVIVGSFNTDLTTYLEKMPRPGETVQGRKFVSGPGGKGSNQAVAAARLGAKVTFIGRIGDDYFGQMALQIWKDEGINTDYVVKDPEHSTGVAPIFVDDSGENMIVVALGANSALNTSDVDSARTIITEADVLLTQLEINHETAGYALKIARENGVSTILNPAPADTAAAGIFAYADYITPNETELEVLTRTSESELSIEEKVHRLIGSGNQTAIVTLGSQGAQYIGSRVSRLIPSHRVDAVDTTGAGDAFNGGLAVALGEGMDPDEAVSFANAAAALCVTKPGTAPSMPYRQEVEDFLSSL